MDQERDSLTVLLLPKYSPELDPVENIRRVVKQRVAANLKRALDAIKASTMLSSRKRIARLCKDTFSNLLST